MQYIYSSDHEIPIGNVVLVEFGKQRCFGIVIGPAPSADFHVKPVLFVYNYMVSSTFLQFCTRFAEYNLISIGSIIENSLCSLEKKTDSYKTLSMIFYLPSNNITLLTSTHSTASLTFSNSNLQCDKLFSLDAILKPGARKPPVEYAPVSLHDLTISIAHFELTENQRDCANIIASSSEVVFLQGVTGSGKTLTALYGLAQRLLINGKLSGKVLIIVPEVSLVQNWIDNVRCVFALPSMQYHYKMGAMYKRSVFDWSLSDEPGFIIGARSALNLPYKNLAAIIVDEEHSTSLKQDRYPRYHARDMAVLRANVESIPCILITATPSLETLRNVHLSKYKHAQITRQPQLGLAECKFVKLDRFKIFAPETLIAIEQALSRNEQIMLFLNRKGYAPYCLCQSCNAVLQCKACDTPKIFYSNGNVVCHKCFLTDTLPTHCPTCKNPTIWRFFGIGVEKVHEQFTALFPGKSVQIMTSDTDDLDECIEKFNANQIQCIIATQIMVQGHDFKNIGLVVVIDADKGLNSPDFRAAEKMYQLWQQVRGRSGRHSTKGQMIVQSFVENNRFVKLFQSDDAYTELLEEREQGNWPPFVKCAGLVFKSKNPALAKELFSNPFFKQQFEDFELLGPMFLGKTNHIYEWQYIIKTTGRIDKIMRDLLAKLPKARFVKAEVEYL